MHISIAQPGAIFTDHENPRADQDQSSCRDPGTEYATSLNSVPHNTRAYYVPDSHSSNKLTALAYEDWWAKTYLDDYPLGWKLTDWGSSSPNVIRLSTLRKTSGTYSIEGDTTASTGSGEQISIIQDNFVGYDIFWGTLKLSLYLSSDSTPGSGTASVSIFIPNNANASQWVSVVLWDPTATPVNGSGYVYIANQLTLDTWNVLSLDISQLIQVALGNTVVPFRPSYVELKANVFDTNSRIHFWVDDFQIEVSGQPLLYNPGFDLRPTLIQGISNYVNIATFDTYWGIYASYPWRATILDQYNNPWLFISEDDTSANSNLWAFVFEKGVLSSQKIFTLPSPMVIEDVSTSMFSNGTIAVSFLVYNTSLSPSYAVSAYLAYVYPDHTFHVTQIFTDGMTYAFRAFGINIDKQDNLHIVFGNRTDTSSYQSDELYYATSLNNFAPTRITNNNVMDISFDFAIDDTGVVHIVWSQEDPTYPNMALMYINSNDFSSPQKITTGTQGGLSPSAIFDSNGIFHVVFHRYVFKDWDVQHIRRFADGSWSSALQLNPNSFPSFWVDMQADNYGNIYIARRITGLYKGTQQIALQIFDGTNWGDIFYATNSEPDVVNDHAALLVEPDTKDVHLFWMYSATIANPVTFRYLNLDAVPPTITITQGPSNNSYVNTNDVLLEAIPSEGMIEHWLNGTMINDPWAYSTIATNLEDGTYEWVIRAYDSAGNQESLRRLFTVDTTPPSITAETSDLTLPETPPPYSLQLFQSYSIYWNVSDRNPNEYAIYKNGTLLLSGTWENLTRIIYALNESLERGRYNYTLWLNDKAGNAATHSIWVTITDQSSPIITSPEDLTITQGDTNTLIKWVAYDTHPSYYVLYQNRTQIRNDTWESGVSVTVSLKDLTPGTYNFTIMFFDDEFNSAKDTVIVTVLPEPTTSSSTPTESSPTPTELSSSDLPSSRPSSFLNGPSLLYSLIPLAILILYKRHKT